MTDGPIAPVQGMTRMRRLESAKSAELLILESDAFAARVAAIVKAATNVAGLKISKELTKRCPVACQQKYCVLPKGPTLCRGALIWVQKKHIARVKILTMFPPPATLSIPASQMWVVAGFILRIPQARKRGQETGKTCFLN